MDASHDDHLDLDNRREELNATLQSLPLPVNTTTSSLSSFNKSLLLQYKTVASPYQTKTNVQTLLLRNNQLTTLTPYAHTLSTMRHSLRELTLRSNAFTEFPKEILVLTELTSFSIAKNQLSHIEIAVFPSLSNLTWLSLSHNHLDSLPSDLVACYHLQGLDLSNNKFHELPLVISQLRQLQVLLIQKNHLSDLPLHSFPSSLQTLNLAFNQFHTVPKILITHPPPALTHLHLSGNPLNHLPEDFLQHGYKNLVSLDLHSCELDHIPSIIFTRPIPLRRLNLAINRLIEIPGTIGRVTQLQWLNLNDNHLVTLPATMSHLVHLVKLGLVQNQLRILPPHLFSHMVCLEKIDLRRNQLVYLPPSILALAPEHEIHQHIDLAVPVTVFYPHRQGGQGGSLKTLLLYENSHLEQKDGIFSRVDDDDGDDGDDGDQQPKEEEEEEEETIQLVGLDKLNTVSNSVAIELDKILQSDNSELFFHPPFSLKDLALRRHLAPYTHPVKQEQDQRRSLLQKVFPPWFPVLLLDTILTKAEQCDHCGEWTLMRRFQVGYLVRLCNNRMQVPIRSTICSWPCAIQMVIKIQRTTELWRTQKSTENGIPPPPLPTIKDQATTNESDRFLTRVLHRVATSLAHCVTSSPPPPALSDPVRLTDPRPALTSFNHLPRDAIRLERF